MRHQTNFHSPFSLFLNFFHHRPETQKIAQQNFLPSIIHELKTPLSAIISYAEMIQQDLEKSSPASDCVEYLKEINRAALGLNELIHDLLDVSSINSGSFSINLDGDIDVADVINRSIRLNYAYALKRQITIESEISETKLIKLDAKRMKQIITNLLSNSIKYSPDNSKIKVSAKSEDNFLIIKIRDHGFGMDEDQVAKAFDRYQTFNNRNSNKVDSFGLGLAIVKELVKGQKGEIEIKSELNEGTEIRLKFPQ